MLAKAKKELPKNIESVERFEIPKAKGHFQGNKTVINNFAQIVDALQRPTQHLLKFLLKELATPAELTKSALILKSRIPSAKINEKINKYANEFVMCKECNKPETKIVKENNYSFLKCLACGAKHPIKSKI